MPHEGVLLPVTGFEDTEHMSGNSLYTQIKVGAQFGEGVS